MAADQDFVWPRDPHAEAWLGYTLDIPEGPVDPETATPWFVPPETTRSLATRAVAWGAFTGAVVYLSQVAASFQLNESEGSAHVADALARAPYTNVMYAAPDNSRYTNTELWETGRVLHSTFDRYATWSEQLDRARMALLGDPSALDIGFVRTHPTLASSWLDLDSVNPPLPQVHAIDARNNRRLLSRLVPDAHGIQVLTRDHLDRAHDLSSWSTQKLGQSALPCRSPRSRAVVLDSSARRGRCGSCTYRLRRDDHEQRDHRRRS